MSEQEKQDLAATICRRREDLQKKLGKRYRPQLMLWVDKVREAMQTHGYTPIQAALYAARCRNRRETDLVLMAALEIVLCQRKGAAHGAL